MAATFAERASPIEQGPRRALLWGAGLLVLGLAAVGVGQADEGAVLALGGLLVIIYGIHRFGRLGPDDPVEAARESREVPAAAATIAAERTAAVDAMFTGGLWLAAGLVVTIGSYFEAASTTGNGKYVIAYGAVLTGGFRFANGLLGWQNARKAQAKVEKKRRLDKSRAP